jgi:dTDP-4-amino-4,6-dideoxy-D-glucose acyltransferase
MLTGITDTELMGDNVRDKLKKCGEDVRIYPLAKLAFPHMIELEDHCRIRDFVFIFAGKGVRIGQYTDMQPHVVIWGGGETIIGNRVSVGPGTVLLSAVYAHGEGLKMVDGLPEGSAKALYGKLVIQDDVYIGANCTLMPNIVIGEGSIIGAASFVNKDTQPWGIYVGSPAKKIGERKK